MSNYNQQSSNSAQDYYNYGSDVRPLEPHQQQPPYQQQQQPPYQQYGVQQGYQQPGGYPSSDSYPLTSGFPPAAGSSPNQPYYQYPGSQQLPLGQPSYGYNQGPPQQQWQEPPLGHTMAQQQSDPLQQQQNSYLGPAPSQNPTQKSAWGDAAGALAAPMQQSSHHQTSVPVRGDSTKPDTDQSRSLSDKLSKFSLHRKNKSQSDSDSSSSDEKSKPKKKANHYNLPAGNYQPYPFSPLCPRSDPELIVLEIVDAGIGHDRLVGPNQDYDHPAYKIEYGDNDDFKLYRCEFPHLDVDKPVWVGTLLPRKDSLSAKVKFKFPWGRWGIDDVTTDEWSSDVGMLEGKHWMRWYFIEDPHTWDTKSFVVRNTDIDEERKPTAAQVIMKNYDNGRIELPARLFRTMEQLDESVLVALAVMSYWRNYVRENPDGKESNLVREEIDKS